MRNTHKCPKCGSSEVAAVEPGLYNSFPVGLSFTGAKIERWVCCDCGYTEEWVEQSDMEKVRKGLDRAETK